MNRADFLDIFSSTGGISKAQAGVLLERLVETMTESLKRGERITIAGFGSLALAHRRARNGRNPRTGEALRIKARRSVRFSLGVDLRKTLNGK